MDADSLKKEQQLLQIRDDAHAWLDKEKQADKFTEFHDTWVKKLTAEVVSTKFLNDHNGYLVALGELRAHKRALDAIQTASERAGRAIRELEELKKAQVV